MTYVTHSEKETADLAATLVHLYRPGAVLCLEGEMGAGKTAFTRGALRALGYTGDVSSPTFALCHRYNAAVPVLHYDLYRLRDEDDLYSIGFYDDIESGACVFIEWSAMARDVLPKDAVTVTFAYGAEKDERHITVHENCCP